MILTKDKNIRRPHGEREDLLAARARVFTLTSGNLSGQLMAELFIQHLPEIERIAVEQAPPFAFAVGPGGVRQILPEPAPPSPDTTSPTSPESGPS